MGNWARCIAGSQFKYKHTSTDTISVIGAVTVAVTGAVTVAGAVAVSVTVRLPGTVRVRVTAVEIAQLLVTVTSHNY